MTWWWVLVWDLFELSWTGHEWFRSLAALGSWIVWGQRGPQLHQSTFTFHSPGTSVTVAGTKSSVRLLTASLVFCLLCLLQAVQEQWSPFHHPVDCSGERISYSLRVYGASVKHNGKCCSCCTYCSTWQAYVTTPNMQCGTGSSWWYFCYLSCLHVVVSCVTCVLLMTPNENDVSGPSLWVPPQFHKWLQRGVIWFLAQKNN